MRMFLKMMLFLSGFVLVGCGGGGGDTGSVTSSNGDVKVLTYEGKTTQAKLTEESSKNFLEIIQNSLGGVAADFNGTKMGSPKLSTQMTKKLSKIASIKAEKILDSQIVQGEISGTLKVTVEETGNFTGRITSVYTNYSNESGFIADGTVVQNITVDTNETVQSVSTEYHMFTINAGAESATVDGKSITAMTSTGSKGTENYILKNNKTDEMIKYENFVSLYNHNHQVVSYAGKVYDSNYGYVNVSTLAELAYNNDGSHKAEGEVLLEGETSSATLKYAYEGRVRVEIDFNKDGAVDNIEVYRVNIEGEMEVVPNSAPVITITFPESIYTDTDMSQVEVTVYDPDLDGFTASYEWTVKDVVKSSTLTLNSTLFVKHDILKLTVTAIDDRAKVGTKVQEQEVLNTNPVASIDSNMTNENIEAFSTVSFDASSSTDKDNDKLTYKWKVYKYIPEEEHRGEPIIDTIWTEDLDPNGEIVFPNLIIEVNASKYFENDTLEQPIFLAGSEGKHIIKCTAYDDDMGEDTTEMNSTIKPLDIVENTESKVFFEGQETLGEWTFNNPIYAYDLNNDGQKELIYFTSDPQGVASKLLHITYNAKNNSFTESYDINDSSIFNIKDFKDFNADGRIDIILGGYTQAIVLQNGQESYENPENIFIYDNMPLIDDVNGDGKIDGIRLNGCILETYTNFDNFEEKTPYLVKGCTTENANNALKIGDFDNDGIDDYMVFSHSTYDEKGQFVVVCKDEQNNLVEGDVTVVDQRVFSESMTMGDVNGDGFNDVIIDFVLFENNKDFTFKKIETLNTKENGSTNDRIIVADINNDKKEDILYNSADILRVLLQGDNYKMYDFEIKSVVENMVISDIDNDGKAEIIENYHNRIQITSFK